SSATITAIGLPAGLTLDPMTGEITGTPTLAGSFSVTLTVTDGALVSTSTLELTFTDDPAFPVITSATSVTLTTRQPFSYTITAPNSDPDDPVTFALIGTFPTGLMFDSTTGTISGTYNGAFNRSSSRPGPDLSGGYPITNVQLVATNSHGTATAQLIFF